MDRGATDLLGECMMDHQTNRPENDLIIRALRGERTERTPVWLMRQAGRFDPAYLQYRVAAGLELEELFAHPEHAARITLLPERFGVDAAILFQDILTLLGPMGAPFRFRPGPIMEHPVRDEATADRLVAYDPEEDLAFIAESIHLALDRLGNRMPLLGFAGAPVTLLNFLVAGGSPGLDPARLLTFLHEHERAARDLLDRLTEITIAYLRMQIRAGVHAFQLFESSAEVLDSITYLDWALPSQHRIFTALEAEGVPAILFARGISPDVMARSGASAISIGPRQCLLQARAAMGEGGIQGNVDNQLLLRGTPDQVRRAAMGCIIDGGHRGHVLNLGHGVIKETPVENVQALIEAAHSTRCREREAS